jgi:hypothetical protein
MVGRADLQHLAVDRTTGQADRAATLDIVAAATAVVEVAEAAVPMVAAAMAADTLVRLAAGSQRRPSPS